MSENGFQPAIPLNIETGSQSELSAELSQMLTLPQEVAGQNITGKVMATVVIEADGAVSKVEITSSPHPALSETVTDCIYRMRFMPANMTENASHPLPLFLYHFDYKHNITIHHEKIIINRPASMSRTGSMGTKQDENDRRREKEAMEQLETLYQFVTGAAFGELDSLAESHELKRDRFPWKNGRTNSNTRVLKRACQDCSGALTRHS